MLVCHDFLGHYPENGRLDILGCPLVHHWVPGKGWVKGDTAPPRVSLEQVPLLEIKNWINTRVEALGFDEGAFVLLGGITRNSGSEVIPSRYGIYHMDPEWAHDYENWYNPPVPMTPWPGIPTFIRGPTLWDHLLAV